MDNDQPDAAALLALGEPDFVELTTFRRTGEAVRTPVWIVRQDDELLVTTPAGAAKLKRLAHTARVELVPCGRGGKVADGATRLTATATVDPDAAAATKGAPLFVQKYGWQYRLISTVESFVGRRKPKPLRRIIRITAA